MRRVNAAAAVSPVSLLALALLSMPRQSMPVADLRRQLELFVFLARELPYSGEISLPEESAEAIIAHGIELSVIHRESHPLGDLIAMNEDQAVLLTYFRNNILHLFAVHASVACVFMNGTKIAEDEIVRIAKLSYPFLRRELFMHWSESAFESAVRASIRAMERIGLLRAAADSGWIARPEGGTRESFQLLQLGQILVPVLQRYYMTIALLGRHGAGALTQAELERLCQLCAERLSIMYGLRSPDFFDRKLFQGFIRELRSRDVLRIDEQGKLHFENTLTQVRIDARRLLGEQIHHSIISVTAVDPEDLAAAASPDIAPVGG